MSFDRYQIGENRYGYRLPVEGEQTLYVEDYGKILSVTWPTALGPEPAITQAVDVFGLSNDAPVQVFTRESNPELVCFGGLHKALGIIKEPTEVVRITSNDGMLSFVWQRALTDPTLFEVGVVGQSNSLNILNTLLSQTGTPEVKRKSETLAVAVHQLIQDFR